MGWWRFDQGAEDSSAQGRACHLVGDAHVEQDGARGSVLRLDGDGDYVDCGPAPELSGGAALSVIAWVKIAALDKPFQSFVALNGEDCGWKLRRFDNSETPSLVLRGTSAVDDAQCAQGINDGRWHHLAGTYDGQTRRIYVDGAPAAQSPDSGAIARCGGGEHLTLGAFGSPAYGGHHFDAHNGWLDDVRVYNRALSAEEIGALSQDDEVASGPTPADEARFIPLDQRLSWHPGIGSVRHEPYLGLSREEVQAADDPRAAPGYGYLLEPHLDPGMLAPNATYYWRVDEITQAGLLRGPVWSFTTRGDGQDDLEGYSLIPAGTFMMGSTQELDPHRCGLDCWDVLEVEKYHQVTLSQDFWMKQTEVTQGEWAAIMGSNPSVFSGCGADCPVENVTWWQTLAFTTALSQREGLEPCYRRSDNGGPYDMDAANHRVHPSWPEGVRCLGYRLPTEAEWEYAARAGGLMALYTGPTSWEALEPLAWMGRNSACNYPGCEGENCRSGAGVNHPAGPHPVGLKQPNDWELYDMLGNIWEFVWDVFGEYSAVPVTDPTEPARAAQGYHVARGGGWLNALGECRVSARDGNDSTCDPDNGPGSHTGFRVARTAP